MPEPGHSYRDKLASGRMMYGPAPRSTWKNGRVILTGARAPGETS